MCGTPEYIAPEVLLGKKYTNTVDFYCLGMIIYEMICGFNPYKTQECQKNPEKMYEIITNEKIKFQFSSLFSPEAKSICQNLLQKNPKKRLGNKGIITIK